MCDIRWLLWKSSTCWSFLGPEEQSGHRIRLCLLEARGIVCKVMRHDQHRRLERLGRRLSWAFAYFGYRCSQVLGVLEAGQNGHSLLVH